MNDLPKPHHRQNSKSQFAGDASLWAAGKNVQFAAKLFVQKDLRKLAKWCVKWRIILNPEKTKVSRSSLARNSEPTLKLYGERLKIYPVVKFLGITFDSKFTFQKHFEEILGRCNTRYHRIRPLVNKKGIQPVHHITNLQTVCPANFRIRLPFDHNSIGHGSRTNLSRLPCIYQNMSV